MFDTELMDKLKRGFAKVGGSKTCEWEPKLFEAMAEHNRKGTLESLKAVKAIQKAIPEQEAQENEKPLAKLTLAIEQEKDQIKRREKLERLTETRLTENQFRVGSKLESYKGTFADPFRKALDQMGETSRWLDGGAGEANAMIEYLQGGGKGKCVATSFRIPVQAQEKVRSATEKFDGRFQYTDGKFLNDMSDEDLGGKGFDLISDLNGVLYYTKTLVQDVKRYLDLLNVGGLLVFTNVHIEIEMPNAQPHSTPAPVIARWLTNISGVSVLYHRSPEFYEVRKTDAEVLVPELELRLYETQEEQNDPIRKYSCVHTLPKEVVKA